ncbi:MAG: SDR family oxidoreductase [Actinomycetota bacterium]|nr:SDR family oxidoreductase [Actinomycetota bacterium]
MELAGRNVVITGAASGIGRALALRCAAEGARGVVVADLDAGGAAAVAAEIGSSAVDARCDVADDQDVGRLIAAAEDAFGAVDVFCANAGIAQDAGLDAGDDVWDRAFGVNVRSHVLAARRLVPGWLERGEGYFVSTASAAGLLTQIGSAPYSVSKHAAVAFAEWLSVTYGDRGVRVSCVCPMGVSTPLLREGFGGEGALSARVVTAAGAVLEPAHVAQAIVAGIRDERFLILPHTEVLDFFRHKAADYDRWLGGMRRLQARFEAFAG